MIIYVAGPMTGLPDFNYPAFIEAGKMLEAEGHTVLNPVNSEKENTGEYQQQSWDWYLRRAIKLLCDAEAIYLLPNWQNSKGATLEVYIADQLGITRMGAK